MKVEDFMGNNVVSLDAARQTKQETTTVTEDTTSKTISDLISPAEGHPNYINLSREIGPEAMMATFPVDEQGNIGIPMEMLRQMLEAASLAIINMMMEHPAMTDEESDSVLNPLEVAVLALYANDANGIMTNFKVADAALRQLMVKYA